MECRCYHGGEGRTRLKELRYAGWDVVALMFGLLLCVGIWVMRYFGL